MVWQSARSLEGLLSSEGRPTEKAVLTSRLLDRPLRPLFPKNYRNDVQVIATVLSVDQDIPPAVYAMIGSSVALSISDIPFAGPTAAVVVGMVDGEYILNPTLEQMEASRLNLTVAGTKDAVMMVEAGAKELSEDEMLEAILFAHEEIKRICAFISDIQAEIGEEKQVIAPEEHDEDFDAKVTETVKERVEWSLDTFDRYERETRQEQIKQEAFEAFGEEDPEKTNASMQLFTILQSRLCVVRLAQQGVRPDGRKTTEVRPIWSEVGILKRPHGSGVFTRGQTQVMTILTLGSMSEVQSLDGLSPEHCKRYMHQYNMPPYSVGETRMMRGPGRREIGPGALAERALEPMIPDEETFPYALRLVSEVISSNGSTSMASVCASTLALMDGGVPIKKPVAGVAMGLIKDTENDSVTILTDIQGLEDFLGDMDFKVAGTKDGITAIQMDIKIKGIDREILTRALAQAKEGPYVYIGQDDGNHRSA